MFADTQSDKNDAAHMQEYSLIWLFLLPFRT